MTISVIIPAYNEAGTIGRTLKHLASVVERTPLAEVIVVDGHSRDTTVQEAVAAGAHVLRSEQKGRATQMNVGAAEATGDVLYFLHADTIPAPDFVQQITEALEQGADCGCMRLRFDRDHWSLRLKAWFSRFNASGLHYGDQSLFVRRELFERVGGYDGRMAVFEDLDLIERLRHLGRFVVLPGPVTTSARKYAHNSMLRMQLTFYIMYPLYRLGASQQRLLRTYRWLIRQDKV